MTIYMWSTKAMFDYQLLLKPNLLLFYVPKTVKMT